MIQQHDGISVADSPRVAIVLDRRYRPDEMMSGYQAETFRAKLTRAGLLPSQTQIVSLDNIASLKPSRVIVGLGEVVLRHFTDKRGIDKWNLSPFVLPSGTVFLPIYDLARLQKEFDLNVYVELALRRAAEFSSSTPPQRAPERFLLNPGLEETLSVLETLKTKPELSVDVETGYGQINTVGFAWSASDAIAINVLPDRFSDHSYFRMWSKIAEVLEGPNRKIFQNFIYDVSYFSAYGIRVSGEIFDTMWAMKVLWPEFKSNLGNVGRIYTTRTYWKDDGKVTDEEGKKKDWGNVRDWRRHYEYNCRDTTGTFEAAQAQRRDLEARRLDRFFSGYQLRLVDPIREMCAVGMPLDLDRRAELKDQISSRLAELKGEFADLAPGVLASSPKQVLSWLKSAGVVIPKAFDKKSGNYRESTDTKSIKKIILKYPHVPGLVEFQQLKTLSKAFSSYINFDVRPDGRLSYSLNGAGTETLRWSGGCDPWDRGFNIQTIPREGGAVSVKSMFVAPEGFTFIEADLKAAETYFVAYASVCKKMMDMLHSGEDIHKFVAMGILRKLNKPDSDYAKKWRDLGKKTGHGSNYLMKAGTFVENVFKDMSMILTKKEGEAMLESYFESFPEIRKWHGWIKNELYTKRKLSAPSGWERYFYGRPGDDMLREAVAWAPQHTVPWIINHMMFYLIEERKHGNLKFHLITQVHDALYLLVPDEWVDRVGRACLRTQVWHPDVNLPGGKLVIPVEVEVAKTLSQKSPFKGNSDDDYAR